MSVGDIADVASRLRDLLPRRWFPQTALGQDSAAPVLQTVLDGLAAPWAWLYALLAYIKQQERIALASGIFLDIAAYDFLGNSFLRDIGQTDDTFRLLARMEILRSRVTRSAMISALTALTGHPPIIFEPARPADTGGYDSGYLGYNVAGAYGDLNTPFQALITAFRPATGGASGVAGYDTPYGGYNGGRIEYADTLVVSAVTDASIIRTVRTTAAAGSQMWLRITTWPGP